MAGGRMRAAVLAGPKAWRVEEVAMPSPTPTQVRIRLEGCGVCGSNLVPWQGREWFQYPFEPGGLGHEAWGVVDAVGAEVRGISEGTRVCHLGGKGFAEYDVAEASQVVPLPKALEGKPFPGEPVACVMNAFRRADVQPGQTVAIIGIGFLGACFVRLAKAAGARVVAITRRRSALEVARNFGADELVPMGDHKKIIETVKGLTNGAFCERVFEVVGEQWPLDLAGELTKERGKLVVAGYHQDGPRNVDMWLWNWRGIDVVNAHERAPEAYVQGMREAVQAMLEGRLDPTPLYTHTFKLEDINRAFEHLQDRPDGFIKALVTP